MNNRLFIFISVICLGLLIAPASTFAADATVKFKVTGVGIGFGAGGGSGTLTYKGYEIPFKVSGWSFGDVGISTTNATGTVEDLTFLEKFNGCYSTSKEQIAIGIGKGKASLRNEAGVRMQLSGDKTGLSIGLGGGCTTFTMDADALARTLAALNAPPVKANYQASVYFDLGSSKIRDTELPSLNKVISYLQENPSTEVIISGYADTTGTEKGNQALSENRADAVYERLKNKAEGTTIAKLPPKRVDIIGRGQVEGPPNTANQEDRRVDILIVPPARAQMK